MADKIFDIAIVGGGPAGLSAALTGRVRNKEIVLFEHRKHSEKLQKAHGVNNYLGMPQVSGHDLVEQFTAHCMAQEPTLIQEKVVTIFPTGDTFTLLTPADTYEARAVIITTGVSNTAVFEGERDFLGRGVSYCATCDGMFYKGKDVAVISYTAEGEHEANFLGEICRTVYYIPQYKSDLTGLRAEVKVVRTKPRAIAGESEVEKLLTEQEELLVQGVFILRQSDPVENILPGIELEGEVIKVARNLSTNIPGVFAAGDCTGKPWQIAKATGEGLVAVLSAISYLETKAK